MASSTTTCGRASGRANAAPLATHLDKKKTAIQEDIDSIDRWIPTEASRRWWRQARRRRRGCGARGDGWPSARGVRRRRGAARGWGGERAAAAARAKVGEWWYSRMYRGEAVREVEWAGPDGMGLGRM